jgi:hypothetical protein
LAAAIGVGITLTTHALRHTNAKRISNCDDHNLGLILINEATGRRVKLCEFEPGQWGRLVVESDGQTGVTAFADASRPGLNSLPAAVRNLVRQGYTKIEFVRADLVDQIAAALASP